MFMMSKFGNINMDTDLPDYEDSDSELDLTEAELDSHCLAASEDIGEADYSLDSQLCGENPRSPVSQTESHSDDSESQATAVAGSTSPEVHVQEPELIVIQDEDDCNETPPQIEPSEEMKHKAEDQPVASRSSMPDVVVLENNNSPSEFKHDTGTASNSIHEEVPELPEIPQKIPKLECEACHEETLFDAAVQCVVYHVLCIKCLEKAAKANLKGDIKGQVMCAVKLCTGSITKSELQRGLHSMILELLEDKWNNEAIEAIKEMEDAVECPECTYQMIVDPEIKRFTCHVCNKVTCRYCKKPWESGQHDFCSDKGRKTGQSGPAPVPANWTEITDRQQDFQKVEVERSSEEFREVKDLFSNTLPNCSVVTIHRVQNNRLWQKYSLVKSHMIEDLGEMHINEKRLFHGTNQDVVDAICREGFDWRLCGQHGTAFGQGTYFARDASYSARYSSSPFHKGGGFTFGGGGQNLTGMQSQFQQVSTLLNQVQGPLSGFGPPPSQQQGSGFTLRRPLQNSNQSNVLPYFGNQSLNPSSASVSSGFKPITSPSDSLDNSQQGTSQQGSTFSFGNPQTSAQTQQMSSVSSSQAWFGQQKVSFGFGNGSYSNRGFTFGNPTTVATSGFTFGNLTTATATGFTFSNPTTIASGFWNNQQNSGAGFSFGYPSYNPSGHQPRNSSGFPANSGESCMLVGRVLAGRTCRGHHGMRRPPKDKTDPQQRQCHTAVDYPNDPTIYVVFDSAQCYPEYIITYKTHS